MVQLPVSGCLQLRLVELYPADNTLWDPPTDSGIPYLVSIDIRNISPSPIKLLSRKWLFQAEDGVTSVVEGDTVFNGHPILYTAHLFNITGIHVIQPSVYTTLTFLAKNDEGQLFVTQPLTFLIK